MTTNTDRSALISNDAVIFAVDARRNPKYTPGRLITSAQMDQKALECLYCMACCCKTEVAQATYVDVYSNNVTFGRPFICCCSTATLTSIATQAHYDDLVTFGQPALKGEVCTPAPFCFVDCFNCCGEALVLRGKCGSGVRRFGHRNQCQTHSWCPYIGCMMPINIMYGLAPGEATRVANIINASVEDFRADRWAREARTAQAMGMPAMGEPIAPAPKNIY